MLDLHGIDGTLQLKEQCAYGEEEARAAVKEMLRIRNMELILGEMYKEKKIRGFCHLGIGQESIPVALSRALAPEDVVISSYRCHGYALVAGVDPKEIFCEQAGSRDGCSRGKGGSMHLFGKSFLGGHGIVGAQVPLGLGAAFAHKYRQMLKEKAAPREKELPGAPDGLAVGEWTLDPWRKTQSTAVTFAVFGDGAANQGQVYESFNMAKLWNLPIVFICENNGYGMGTAVPRASASLSFYDRVSFVPGIRTCGTNVFALGEVLAYARTHALKKGPIVVEVVTYRYNGHSMTDAFTEYRSKEEIEQRKKRDCIEAIKGRLGPAPDRVFAELNEAAYREMASLREVSVNSQRCLGTDLFTDILL